MTTERERAFTASRVELRSAANGGRPRIGGHAIVVGKRSRDLGGFIERVDAGALRRSKTIGWDEVTATFNHVPTLILGSTRAGTLELTIDATGLAYVVELPEARSDLLELVSRGDVSRSSFSFSNAESDWGLTETGFPQRTLTSFQLWDVSAVVQPAYTDSTVGLRDLAEHVGVAFEDVQRLAARDALRSLFVRSDAPTYTGRAAQSYLDRIRVDPWLK